MARKSVPDDLEWISDAASRVGRHPATLRLWAQQGYLKRYKKALDRRTFVSRSELDMLLAHPPAEERG